MNLFWAGSVNELVQVGIKDSDLPMHPWTKQSDQSLRWVFDGKQSSIVSLCGKLRLIILCGCADWCESLLFAHANLYLMRDTGITAQLTYWNCHRKLPYLTVYSIITSFDAFENIMNLKILWKMEHLLFWSKCSIFQYIFKSTQNLLKFFLIFQCCLKIENDMI